MNREHRACLRHPAVGAAKAWCAILLAICLAFVAPLSALHAAPVGRGETVSEVGAPVPAASAITAAAQTLPVSCGESGFAVFTTLSIDGEIVRQCTLTVPTGGSLFISSDGSLVNWDGPYGVRLWVNVDSTENDPGTTRWVDVYDDGSDGSDKSIAVSVLKPITAGTHTVYVVASRWGGTGTVMIRDTSLSAVFIPSTGSELLACGDSGPLVWLWAFSVSDPIRQCTLQIPQNGLVFLSADGTAAYSDGEYEAEFRFGVDSPTGDQETERWVDVYSDAGDGTDEQLAMSSSRVVGPGEHTFYLTGRRVLGTGTATLWNPTLTAIYIPLLGSHVVTCWSREQAWSTSLNDPLVVVQCTAHLPQAGWAYLSADGSLVQWDGDYEVHFQMQVDDAAGNLGIHRWVNVYTDTADGTDKSFRLSALTQVEAGEHDFMLMAERTDGSGAITMQDPWLSVFILPRLAVFLPLVIR